VNGIRIVRRLGDALQRLGAGHLLREDKAGVVRPVFLVAEASGEPIPFVKARKPRLVVLLGIPLVADTIDQLLHGR
jgi:hypothetical protein